jgi:hypothetical protein
VGAREVSRGDGRLWRRLKCFLPCDQSGLAVAITYKIRGHPFTSSNWHPVFYFSAHNPQRATEPSISSSCCWYRQSALIPVHPFLLLHLSTNIPQSRLGEVCSKRGNILLSAIGLLSCDYRVRLTIQRYYFSLPEPDNNDCSTRCNYTYTRPDSRLTPICFREIVRPSLGNPLRTSNALCSSPLFHSHTQVSLTLFLPTVTASARCVQSLV